MRFLVVVTPDCLDSVLDSSYWACQRKEVHFSAGAQSETSREQAVRSTCGGNICVPETTVQVGGTGAAGNAASWGRRRVVTMDASCVGLRSHVFEEDLLLEGAGLLEVGTAATYCPVACLTY
jgi:hypothetical protein